jgi:acetyltransferase-like isoleucine patch superfamily enzyme
MYQKIKDILVGYGFILGFIYIYKRLKEKFLCKLNARILGWEGAHIYSGSRIVNPKFIKMGRNFYSASPVWIEAVFRYKDQKFKPFIEIGNNFSCSDGLHISAVKHVVIGDNCLFGSNVYVGDHNHGSYSGLLQSHPEEPPNSRALHSNGEVTIGKNTWIGSNVLILGPADIGEGCIIAANSIVKGNYNKNTIIAGSPAREIKEFNEKTKAWIRKQYQF